MLSAFAAVVCSSYRTNVFARRVVAMLTQHWLEHGLNAFRIIRVTTEVTVDTQPVHIVVTRYLVFTYDRNVVLYMTGYHAGAATNNSCSRSMLMPHLIPGLVISHRNGFLYLQTDQDRWVLMSYGRQNQQLL